VSQKRVGRTILRCSGGDSAFNGGVATLTLPADRPVTCQVRDTYGRDLNAVYKLELPTGTTPVTHTFTIRY
jgi:hypothetical protein